MSWPVLVDMWAPLNHSLFSRSHYYSHGTRLHRVRVSVPTYYAPSYMGSSDTLAVGHFEPNPIVKLDNGSRGSISATWF